MNRDIHYLGHKPRLIAPPGSCDCHSHVYGPLAQYPYAPGSGRNLQPDAPVAAYRAQLDHLGIQRAVIAQPSAYGIDNRRSIDAIREMGIDRTRGVAVCSPDVPPSELKALDAAGMRGIRLNRLSQSHDVTIADLEPMAKRLAPIGWHLQVQEDGVSAMEWLPRLKGLPVPVVIDHVAKLPKGMSLNDPRFVALLRLLEDGNTWIKLSAPYHGSANGHPYADMVPRIRALVEARPDRMLWALNWPHPPFAVDNKPEPAACLDVILDAVPDAATRKAILADNAERLYGFPPI